jgi:CheY-like chemotaxis protein
MQRALSQGFVNCPKDVLIVEDDPLLALDFEDMLLGLGVPTVRAAATVATALDMITSHAPDFALLDVGLIHGNSYAVAERLEDLKIPFAFITGYDKDKIAATFVHAPILSKPYSHEALQALLHCFGCRS